MIPEEPLKSVGRAGAGTTTIAYEVPVSGAGAPNDMSAEAVAKWGQRDLPVEATAIFPPTHVPAKYPPSEYTGATIHYLDPEGHQVDVASPSPPGVSGASITTTETDAHGDVVRQLSARNRLLALEAPDTVARSHELDTHSVYNAAGTEQLESWGPLHSVRLESGEVVQARAHTVTHYDEGAPAPPAGTPPAYLPTKETAAAVVPGKEGELEPRTTETHYKWSLLLPEETIVDPGGLNIRSVTHYNERGQVVETSQPSNPGGGGVGSTRTVYYSYGSGGECVNSQYTGLPCKVLPATNVEGSGRPFLPVKRFVAYDNLDEPEKVLESPNGETPNTRTTTTEYDSAGRPRTVKVTGGGTEVPATRIEYSPTTGTPEKQQFVCESGCTPGGTYSSSFGSAGTGNGQFADPAGDAIDAAGDIWVADDENDRIEEFNAKGEFVLKFGGYGTGNGQFRRPSAVAIDPLGNLWVTDAENHRVQEFNPKGEFLRKFGTSGTGKSQFSEPESLAVDSKGDIWVADTYNNRVQEFNSKGEYIKVVGSGLLHEAQGIAISAANNVFVTSSAADAVVEFNEAGEKVGEFGAAGSGEGQFEGPEALTVDGSGDVWVTDPVNDRVDGFTQAGKFIGRFGKPGSGAGELNFGYWDGIASDGKGDLFVVDTHNNRVEKWTVSAGFNPEATRTKYNALGEVEEYEDADANVTKTTYDAYGRPVTSSDARGSRTITYDPTSGVPTSLEVTGIGTFTAHYDADGDLIEQGLSNGLTRRTTYNVADEPTNLAYTKTSSCGESCTWYEETLERSIEGRILSGTSSSVKDLSGMSSTVKDRYTYDKAGRLAEAQETPAGGKCTSRAYTYDADSNRLTKTTRNPGIEGAMRDLRRYYPEIRIRRSRSADRPDLRRLGPHRKPSRGICRRQSADDDVLRQQHGRHPGPERGDEHLPARRDRPSAPARTDWRRYRYRNLPLRRTR